MLCYTCRSLSGEKSLFLESRIYEGKYWVVEHVYPVKLKGWFVVILKRHTEALHNLTSKEFSELAIIISKLTKFIHKELICKKEYVACFAEKNHFQHIHFHVIARPNDLKKKEMGPKVFRLLKVSPSNSIPKKEIIILCTKLKKKGLLC